MITGYVANFKVDLRDKTTIADMMRQVLDGFNVPGIKVFADNLFVSVEMLRWCRTRGINLAGTTRRTYGFPQDLDFAGMEVSCWHIGVAVLMLLYLLLIISVTCMYSCMHSYNHLHAFIAWRFRLAHE